MGRNMQKRIYFFILTAILSVAYIQPAVYTATQFENLSLRRSKDLYLNRLLSVVTSEAVSGLTTQARFVIHSGPSGVGQGTIKEAMLKNYPGRFQRFLLYATRARRGIELSPDDPRYDAVKAYYESVENLDSIPLTKEQVSARVPADVSRDDRDNILNALFPDWESILADAPREDIPLLTERIEFLENGHIVIYTEFNGVQYLFVTEQELREKEIADGVIVEPVRDYYQGLDIKAAEEALSSGDKIY
ncbi:MAG TPA: hypothetical protein ENN78_01665, partial [Candidatus Omnitrophica bacterium]|nr:hypothetical protein [Candidatus Omnitrophota bacterium]